MVKFFKRAGNVTLLSALLCAVVFFFTGFALCSISASADVSNVQSGALDIAFEMYRDEAWVNAEGVTMDFLDAENPGGAVVWEPGCTYELPRLRIRNNSDFDVKYTVNITGINGDDKLNEVIAWTCVSGGTAGELGTIAGTLAAGAETDSFTIRGHMLEEASNAYQGLCIDSIALSVVATQIANPNDPGQIESGTPYYSINTDRDLIIDERGTYVILDDAVQNYLASVDGQKITVSNATFTGSTYSFMLGQYRSANSINYNLEANNVHILDLHVANGVSNGTDKVSIAVYAYGKTTLNDCVMMGTTSSAEGYGVYDLGFVNGSTGTVNGGRFGSVYIWSQAHVTFTDAQIDRIVSSAITTRNLGMLTIAEGTHVGTIDLTVGGFTKYKPALTIEDGAVVDRIIYQGVTYTQEEWLARDAK